MCISSVLELYEEIARPSRTDEGQIRKILGLADFD